MDLCMQMVKHLMLTEIKKTNPENSVLSPLSINVVLNMIAAGTVGATLENLLNLLKCNNVDEIIENSHKIMAVANNTGPLGPTVTSINGVWGDKRYPLKAPYVELLKQVYNCEANTDCDFLNEANQVVNEINSWAEAQSRGLIKQLLQKFDPQTTYIRANALYFKGKWSIPFDPEDTKTKDFFLLDGTTIQVPFLSTWGGYEYYESFDGYSVLGLPYQRGPDSSFSMYFFLPNDKNKLLNLLQKFDSDPKHLFLDSGLKLTQIDIIRIPKFKFLYNVNVSDTMKRMGLEIPYKGNQQDYAEMVHLPEDLPPSKCKILQKAYIEVDESGTEASVVTCDEDYFGFSFDSDEPRRPDFIADHPFIFVIKEDKSGLILFTGVVVNPESN